MKNREAILARDGGRAIVEAIETLEDDLRRQPLQIGPVLVRAGTGDPEGRFDDPIGALYLRINDGGPGATLYVKEARTALAPSKGWAAK